MTTKAFRWPFIRLGDVLTFNGSGATPRGGKDSYLKSGIPLVRSMNVHDLRFDTNDLAFIDEAQAGLLNRVQISSNDVLLNITGASVARCCLATDSVVGGRVNQHVMILRVDPRSCDAGWLVHALAGPYKNQLLSIAGSGATREALTKSDLERFAVSLPPIEIQRHSADLLGTYACLIENNRRRIEILEEMARLLYREWFVHFRFPGHEDVELVDSDLGPIPEGWAVGQFQDLVSESKKTVAAGEIPEGSPLVGLEHLPRRSTTLHEWNLASEVGSRRKTFLEGDILFGKIRPYFHKVADAPVAGFSSTDAIVFRPTAEIRRNRALAIASSDEFIEVATLTSNGTKMPRANTEILMAYGIPHPTDDIERAFNETLGPMDSLRKVLAEQNRNLREARDLLLPRLVSGELDVSELDLGLVEA